MKKYFLYILLISFIFPKNEKLVVSILDFKGEGVDKRTLKACFQNLETNIISSDRFVVIEKSSRDEILEEQKFQQSGICDDDCIVQIGQLIGAEYLIIGEILGFSELFQIDIKIVNIEKGNIEQKVTRQIEGKLINLLNAINIASNHIVEKIEPSFNNETLISNENSINNVKHINFEIDEHNYFEKIIYKQNFYPDGRLKNKTGYIGELRFGRSVSYYNNGQKKKDCEYFKDKIIGVEVVWYEDGTMESEISYKNSQYHGESHWWWPSGDNKLRAQFMNGLRHGFYKKYSSSGKLILDEEYENGNLIKAF